MISTASVTGMGWRTSKIVVAYLVSGVARQTLPPELSRLASLS